MKSVGKFLLTKIIAIQLLFCAVVAGMLIYRWPPPADPSKLFPFPRMFMGQEPAGVIVMVLLLAIIYTLSQKRPDWFWNDKVKQLLTSMTNHPKRVALWSFLLAVGISFFVYHGLQICQDEIVPLWQAKIFAAGRLSVFYPVSLVDRLVPVPFQNIFVSVSHSTGEVASKYWPGFALLLTPFAKLGLPFLLNPLLFGGNLFILSKVSQRFFSDKILQALCLMVMIASAQYWAYAGAFFSMNAHIFFNLLFLYFLLRGSLQNMFVAGMLGSFALILSNPVPHMLFCLPWFIWLFRKKTPPKEIAALLLGYLPLCICLGLGWYCFGDQILASDVGPAAVEKGGLSGFLAWLGKAFSLPRAIPVVNNLVGLARMSLWCVPGILCFAYFGFARAPKESLLRPAFWSMLLTFLVYFFVRFDPGHSWGHRYMHPALGVLPLLAVAGLSFVAEGFDGAARKKLYAFFIVACFSGILILIPLRLFQVYEFTGERLHTFPCLDENVPHICFIKASKSIYHSDLVINSPFLDTPRSILVSHGAEADAELVRRLGVKYVQVFENDHGTIWQEPRAKE